MAAAVFRTIFAQPDPESMSVTWDAVRDQLAARWPKIGPYMDAAKIEVLTFNTFPRATPDGDTNCHKSGHGHGGYS